MPGKVADASVMAAIAFGEPRADEAGALLDGSDIFAPTLLAYELTNVAMMKARAGAPGPAGDVRWEDATRP